MAASRRLLFAPSAAADLEEIYSHISEEAPSAARNQVKRILGTADSLREFPEMGQARDRLSPGLRSVVKDNYVIFYYLNDDRIEIVRVLHGRRDVENEMLSFITEQLQR